MSELALRAEDGPTGNFLVAFSFMKGREDC